MKKFFKNITEKIVAKIAIWRIKRQIRAEIKSLQELLECLESNAQDLR